MISRLIYTNSGVAILALASNAIHLPWKWSRNERNSSGKATASVPPQLWQPPSGILMTNDIMDTNPEEAVPCFALSKNDSYVMSASGGKISLFNMMTFKTMTTFMPPPPAVFLQVKSKLRGHSKRITGLAFSHVLNVLVHLKLMCSSVFGVRMGGRSRRVNLYKFLLAVNRMQFRTLKYSFIRIRYTSWLYTRHRLLYLKPIN